MVEHYTLGLATQLTTLKSGVGTVVLGQKLAAMGLIVVGLLALMKASMQSEQMEPIFMLGSAVAMVTEKCGAGMAVHGQKLGAMVSTIVGRLTMVM